MAKGSRSRTKSSHASKGGLSGAAKPQSKAKSAAAKAGERKKETLSRAEPVAAGKKAADQPKPAIESTPAVAAKTKRTTVSKTASGDTATEALAAKSPHPARPISMEERHRMIAEAAYYRALRRGFQGGSAEQDWFEAVREVEARLSGAHQ